MLEITVAQAKAAYEKNGLRPNECNMVPTPDGRCCVVGAILTDKYGRPVYEGGDAVIKLNKLIKEFGREYVYGMMYGFDDGPTSTFFANLMAGTSRDAEYKAGYARGVDIHKVLFKKD